MSGVNKYYYIERVKRGKSTATEAKIKDIISQTLIKMHVYYNPYETQIINAFFSISGSVISKFVEDAHMQGQLLFVKISLPAMKSELLMNRDLIKDAINNKLDKPILKDIVIK